MKHKTPTRNKALTDQHTENIKIDHEHLELADKLTLLSELEHTRRHLIRSAHVAEKSEDKFFYQVKAAQAKRIRREVQRKWLNTSELDWCIVKSTSTIKQLNSEVLAEDLDLFSEIERFSDELLGHAFGVDLSGCKACAEDKSEIK